MSLSEITSSTPILSSRALQQKGSVSDCVETIKLLNTVYVYVKSTSIRYMFKKTLNSMFTTRWRFLITAWPLKC